MDDSPKSRMTFRQALSRQWQIPLLLLSGVAFVMVLWQVRPEEEAPATFEERLAALRVLSYENRYAEFYQQAELLRLQVEDNEQLGQVHLLAAQTRVKQLDQRNEFAVDLADHRSATENYEAIITDYSEAIARDQPGAESPESSEVYHDIALAYWCQNQAERAIHFMKKAIEVDDKFSPIHHRNLVQMYFWSRPEGYLELSMGHLEDLLSRGESSVDDKAWAFLRKSEVLLDQGEDEQALALLEGADPSIRVSQYGGELEFLRGRALHQIGRTDEADILLRDLLERSTQRGDTYARTALELGAISYEQFRDFDALRFFQLVIDTQLGKDWYVSGKYGVAQAMLLQQRYLEAMEHIQDVIDILKRNPLNRALSAQEVQRGLAIWAQKFGLLKQYDLALSVLELEQQLAAEDDLYAAQRYAQVLTRRAAQLVEQVRQSEQAERIGEVSDQEAEWLQQQRQLVATYYEKAAEQYHRVSDLVSGDDELYGDCLWQAAVCYDKAGNATANIAAWERYVLVREGEARWPRALFNLAQSYQAIGEIDRAITYYETLLSKHPTSLAAFDGVVPLAHCFLIKEPPERERAEVLLKSILENTTINPPSSFFRDALFELGELYYDSQNYPEAINKLTEAIDRYPQDRQLGKSMYLVGDSYRRSGLGLDALLTQLDQDPSATVRRQKTFTQRQSYLEDAREYFDRAVAFYTALPISRRNETDEMYMRHCWLYRADCMYDLGHYQEASELYELAALRYQLTPTALAAFVQIVNCQLKLGKPGEARSANQRAIWQLRNMPDEAIVEGPGKLSRGQWQAWFDRTERSNLW